MSTPTFDIGAIVNAVVNAFGTMIQSFAEAIANNAGIIGQALALGAVIFGVTYAIVRTPFGRWLRRLIPM